MGTIQGAALEAAAQQVPSAADVALPTWAYPMNPSPGGGGAASAPDEVRHGLPGTDLTFTRAEITNGFGPADWRPETHPSMPDIVARGREPDVRACALCHYPNGQGRPENGPVSGFPAAYIVQQLVDFQNGTRASSEPRMGPPAAMVRLAKAMTAEEMEIAAEYFASFPYRSWVRVVEAATVPRLRFAGGMFMPVDGSEPIGNRIVEVPEDTARTLLRDPTSGFIAYVPPGSLARGEALASTGADRTTACGACHGDDLRGLGPVPAIAGRSASYLMRQLVDFKTGARAGAWSPLMKGVVANLTEADMLALAAYAASRSP
jgi:cytochrome c553